MSGTDGEEGVKGDQGPVPLIPRLDSGLTDYDRRLVALAEKAVEQAMAKQPPWLTDEQRKAIRYEMMVDLLIDPRGIALVESLVDGPQVDESDEVDRSGRLLPMERDGRGNHGRSEGE